MDRALAVLLPGFGALGPVGLVVLVIVDSAQLPGLSAVAGLLRPVRVRLGWVRLELWPDSAARLASAVQG